MKAHEGTAPNDPLGDMMRDWASMACAAMPRPFAPSGPFAASAAAAGPGTNPSSGNTLAQAHMAAAAASLRAWTRSAQSLSVYQQECSAGGGRAGDAGDAGDAQAALHADAARAHLRRLGEIALEEARALDAQLQGLGEQLRAQVADPATPAQPPPRRYARAKP